MSASRGGGSAARDGGAVARVLELARRNVGLDAAVLSRVARGQQTYLAAAGDAALFGIQLGVGLALGGTLCTRMLAGQLPSVLRDVARDHRVADLALPSTIGAYLGVPLHLPDGRLFGTLCCLGRRAVPSLDGRDVGFLSLLAEYLGEDLAGAEDDGDDDDPDAVAGPPRIEIALQPAVSLRTGALTALEALARFPDDVGPEAAFAAAAAAGRRTELEVLAVRRALELQGLLPVPLAVNVSPDVALGLEQHLPDDVRIDRLVLELTEHQEVLGYAAVRERLQPLREHGLRLAVDDTGAGFASLRHVVELQPDVLKVDRSLVAGIDEDRARRSVVTTFTIIAGEIGATVTAEGVETEAELAVLADLGVDEAQGFLLAPPSTDRATWATWTASGARLLPGREP